MIQANPHKKINGSKYRKTKNVHSYSLWLLVPFKALQVNNTFVGFCPNSRPYQPGLSCSKAWLALTIG